MSFQPIETDRLVLRGPEPGDVNRLRRLIGDWQVARMTANVPYPYTGEMAADWIAKASDELAAGTAYHLAVERRDKPGQVGTIGLAGLGRDQPVLGYWIGRPYWGRGYATEAAGGMLNFGFATLGVTRIIASVLPANRASRRVLEKLGFVFTGRAYQDAPARGMPQEVETCELTRAAFEKASDE